MRNVSKDILKKIALNESPYYSRKASEDYKMWSTVHFYQDRIKDKLRELVEKIDNGEITDIKEISKEIQRIIES